MTTASAEGKTIDILVYSDNRDVRDDIMRGLGRKVGKGGPAINWTESATPDGAIAKIREAFESDKKFDLLVLDAETPKLGGIGLGKMVRDEIDPDAAFVIYIARPQDEWLARVSKPNAILSYPVNSKELTETVARVLSTEVAPA